MTTLDHATDGAIRHDPPQRFRRRRGDRLAFGRDDEALLVDQLRVDGDVTLSLVAVGGNRVVGHVLFCPLTTRSSAGPVLSLALAPLAVLPSHERRGIGARLVREGLTAATVAGHRLVTVLGHAEHYPRFGFSPPRRSRPA